MTTLELAEGAQYANLSDAVSDNYINVPDPSTGQLIKIREDLFDDLDSTTFRAVMEQLAPYNVGMNGLFSAWIDRRQAKKEDRQADRQSRITERRGFFRDIAGTIFGGGQAPADTMATRNITGGFNLQTQPTPWYQNPLVWVVGGTAVVGGIYLATRKKK